MSKRDSTSNGRSSQFLIGTMRCESADTAQIAAADEAPNVQTDLDVNKALQEVICGIELVKAKVDAIEVSLQSRKEADQLFDDEASHREERGRYSKGVAHSKAPHGSAQTAEDSAQGGKAPQEAIGTGLKSRKSSKRPSTKGRFEQHITPSESGSYFDANTLTWMAIPNATRDHRTGRFWVFPEAVQENEAGPPFQRTLWQGFELGCIDHIFHGCEPPSFDNQEELRFTWVLASVESLRASLLSLHTQISMRLDADTELGLRDPTVAAENARLLGAAQQTYNRLRRAQKLARKMEIYQRKNGWKMEELTRFENNLHLIR